MLLPFADGCKSNVDRGDCQVHRKHAPRHLRCHSISNKGIGVKGHDRSQIACCGCQRKGQEKTNRLGVWRESNCQDTSCPAFRRKGSRCANRPWQIGERLPACDFFAQLAHCLFKRNKFFFARCYAAAAFGQNVAMPSRRLRLCCGGHCRPQVFHRLDSFIRRHPVYGFHHCWHEIVFLCLNAA